MANLYSTLSRPDELVTKLLVFTKYEEIPLRQFIGDLRMEKKLIDTNKQNKMYRHGLSQGSAKDNILEFYYIVKCRELGDSDNFLSHNIPIKIDFSMMI